MSTSNEITSTIIQNEENESGYLFDALVEKKNINKDAIRKSNFTLSEKHNFQYHTLRNLFSRKNIIYYGKIVGEEPIPIELTEGNIVIPIINKQQIRNRIQNIKEIDRSKIAYIHISTIQIILKSTFSDLDTPIELEIRDDRIINNQESIIAKGKGNLIEGKIKFNINIQLGLSLKDKNLNNSITVRYRLLRNNFMLKGNHPFTITYQINYALTNSHHSITFKTDDRIHIDKLFEPLITLETPRSTNKLFSNENTKRTFITPLIRREPTIEPPIAIHRSSTSNNEELHENIDEIKGLIRSLSQRI
jgi:hypothetical protein